nr:HNH endonuclease signature motif containing protein [Pseudomonas proteolytica]
MCQEPSPFNRKDGTPYLETHHIEWLVHGGANTVENTVALCPNCHRKMHVLEDQADQILLVARVNAY